MGSFTNGSPNIQPVGTPFSNFSHNSNVASVQHSPVTSFVVPGSAEPLKIVSSPNLSHSGGFEFSQSSNPGQDGSQTREISTVYLPPIRYRYDSATGALVQLSGPSSTNPQVKSPESSAPPSFSHLNLPAVSYTSTGQENPLSQHQNLFNQNSNVFGSPQATMNYGYRMPNFNTQAYPQPLPQTFVQPGPQAQSFMNPQFENNSFPNYSGFQNQFGQGQGPQAFSNQQFKGPVPGFSNQRFQQPAPATGPGPLPQSFGNLPTFGNQMAYEGAQRGGNLNKYNENLYMDTPRARYEAAVKDYYDRMNGNFHNYNQPLESPNGLAQAFSTFENVASKFFSGTDAFVSDFKDAAFKILNPNSSDYLKAAVFKLQRLENVPVNPNSVSKLSFNVVAYFDPKTENYDVHKSEKQWALPTEKIGLVDCDLKGETLKVPWRGEEFIFLKILENVGPNRFVLGRLQLKLDTLVTGHPLKVTVIGDDGQQKGNAILEFAVGAVSMEEFNQMKTRKFMNASYRRNNEENSKNNTMPGYDAMLEQKNLLESERYGWPRTRLANKGQRLSKQNDDLMPPLKYLVSWCCNITDHDLR
ncbi:hypothetical protein MACJ_000201 [Theileria orientalis]|uniref:Uncharacterized protein n=1 Tax=Theileria orientalis TaxID=68886 RepID=A0A976M3N5_THEOR|nr:hypothetical protein MACJ_000201 [Theileria orientalis]